MLEKSHLLLSAAVVISFPQLWGVCAPGSWLGSPRIDKTTHSSEKS